MVFGLFKDGKEVHGWFWNCTGSPVVKSMQISLHIHSLYISLYLVKCTLCWIYRFFFFSPGSLCLVIESNHWWNLLKCFLVYQLQGETLDFLELWLHSSHQCPFELYSCCEERLNIWMCMCFPISIILRGRLILQRPFSWRKAKTEIIQAPTQLPSSPDKGMALLAPVNSAWCALQ